MTDAATPQPPRAAPSDAGTIDDATRALLHELQARHRDHPLVQAYHQRLQLPQPLDRSLLAGQLFVLVRGWLHTDAPATGADLQRQHSLLQRLGARVHLADVAENATIEANADRLRHELAVLSRQHPSIVVVSVSKAGIEVACALTALAGTAAAHSVRAWLNIGGLLRGTPLADLSLAWWMRWLTRLYIVPDRQLDALRGMTPAASASRGASLAVPAHICVVNVVGLPLRRELSALGRLGHWLLRRHGVNDGVTRVADALLDGAPTIAVAGADHYFMIPDLDARTQALLHSVLSQPAVPVACPAPCPSSTPPSAPRF